jgi:hypothetical protein
MATQRTRIPTLDRLVGEKAEEYVKTAIRRFKDSERRGGATGALLQFDIVHSTHTWVHDDKWKSFCTNVRMDPASETTEKTIAIGDKIVRATAKLEEWGPFGLLYASTMLDKPKFESFFQWGRSAAVMDASELREGIITELIEGRRPFR